jgi:hypothetical protein
MVAVPPDSAAAPSEVALSAVKLTEPVGVPLGEVTVAVITSADPAVTLEGTVSVTEVVLVMDTTVVLLLGSIAEAASGW